MAVDRYLLEQVSPEVLAVVVEDAEATYDLQLIQALRQEKQTLAVGEAAAAQMAVRELLFFVTQREHALLITSILA